MGGPEIGFCPPRGFCLGIGRKIISALYVGGTVLPHREGSEGMRLALFDLTPEDKGQTDEAVGALDGFVGLFGGLPDGVDNRVYVILINVSWKHDFYLTDERHIDATGIAAHRTEVFAGHMAMLVRQLSEELFLCRCVKQVGVEGMIFAVIDETVASERRTGADGVAIIIGVIDICEELQVTVFYLVG